MSWQNYANRPSTNALAQRLRQTDPLAHQDCIMKMDRLQGLVSNLKQQVDRQVKDNQALSNRISLNDNREGLLLKELGRTSPEVERLKLENYALENQLKQVYVKPDTFFKSETQPRRFEEEDEKNKQIRMLRKQLEIVRTECLKASSRGSDYMDAKHLQRLVRENQALRDYLKTRANKAGRGGPLPPHIQKIVGVQTSKPEQASISVPEIAALNESNNQLRRKIEQFNEREKILLYQLQIRQGVNKQAKQLNAALRKQYAQITNKDALQKDRMLPDPLQDKVRKLQAEIMRMRTNLAQQQIRQSQYNHQLQVAAQRINTAAQLQAMQRPLLVQEIERKKMQSQQKFIDEPDLDLQHEEQDKQQFDLQNIVTQNMKQYPTQSPQQQQTQITKQTVVQKRTEVIQPQRNLGNRLQQYMQAPDQDQVQTHHYTQVQQQQIPPQGYEQSPTQYQQQIIHQQQQQYYQQQQTPQIVETVRRTSQPLTQIPTQQTIIINLNEPMIPPQPIQPRIQPPQHLVQRETRQVRQTATEGPIQTGVSLHRDRRAPQQNKVEVTQVQSEILIPEERRDQQPVAQRQPSRPQDPQHMALRQPPVTQPPQQFPYSTMFDSSSELQNLSSGQVPAPQNGVRRQSSHGSQGSAAQAPPNPTAAPASSRRNFNVHDMFDESV